MHSELNLPCPYKVFRFQEDNSLAHYEFTTDSGIVYYIYFNDCDHFPDTVLNDNSYLLSFGPKTPINGSDRKVKETIIEVLKYFFSTREKVLLFLCDSNDGRQISRHRLFNQWHCEYSKSINTAKFDASIKNEELDFEYHSSLILRSDNPNFKECIEAFNEFHSDLSNIK